MLQAPDPSTPELLPSRSTALDEAVAALEAGRAVVVTGPPGIGRSTFAAQLLAARRASGHETDRLAGDPALAEAPFAALAVLGAGLSSEAGVAIEPADAIARLARVALLGRRTLLVDDAEHLDTQTAAALAQLHGRLELIVTVRDLSALPRGVREAMGGRTAHRVELGPIGIDDARFLLEREFDARFNISAVNVLRNVAAGVPLQLRELAHDAVDAGALVDLHGFRTLESGWTPEGGRTAALVSARLETASEASRTAIERLAVSGPLPQALARTLFGEAPLDAAIDHGALTVTTDRERLDIAQSFDGPGARARLTHPEPWVLIGAGLTPELVLAAMTRTAWRGHAREIEATIGLEALPAESRRHLERHRDRLDGVPPRGADRTELDAAGAALGDVVERIVDELYAGRPDAGAALFREHVNGPMWDRADSNVKTALIQAMFLAIIGEGSRADVYDDAFAEIDWHALGLDHAVFLAGYGYRFLEAGDAAAAAEAFTQVLGLIAADDPNDLAGFVHGLDAVAATMLGDRERAAERYARHVEAPVTSGGIARPEAERLTLLVLCDLDGPAAGGERLDALVATAERRGEHLKVLRLLHEAWRLRLVDATRLHEHLERMRWAATRVRGTLARILEHYAAAFTELEHDGDGAEGGASGDVDAAGDADAYSAGATVEALIARHLETGRPLYAAELAARAVAVCTERGDRRRTGHLLASFAEATAAVPGVTTPSLGRVRLDPEVLSEREYEVCDLAAAGLSTPKIAERLVLSPRTVEGHLQRAYAKLGVGDRRQLLPALERGPGAP